MVRLTIGAMFLWVFFENLGKDLYKPEGYAELIKGYIQDGNAPAVWKKVMALLAAHAVVAAPLQGLTEISLGVLLLLGLFTRPVALVAFAFLASLWISACLEASSSGPVITTDVGRFSEGKYCMPER